MCFRFTERMERVAAFLSSFMSGVDGETQWLAALGVDFRVNQEREVGGNQIVDWALRVGDQSGGVPFAL